MFVLTITHHDSGHVQVLTFPSLLERSLWMIALAGQPVTLRIPEAS